MAESWKCPLCSTSNAFFDKVCTSCKEPKMSDAEAHKLNIWRNEITSLLQEFERAQVAVTPKWTYLELTTDQLEGIVGGLNGLGLQGWELVSAATYQVGGVLIMDGVGGSNFKVKTLYVFKRQLFMPDWYDPPFAPRDSKFQEYRVS